MADIFYKKKKNLVDAPERPKVNTPRATWLANHRLICPRSGTDIFGMIPEIKPRDPSIPIFPAGAIHLCYGEHFGANTGFGFQHIWAEHFRHASAHDDAMDEVCRHVAAVLASGTEILYSRARQDTGQRASVHRLHTGLAIVELQRPSNGAPFYSVVTSYRGGQNTKGSLIGALV